MAKNATKQKTCVHYWIIDSSHHGVCRYCGAEQDFPSWDDLAYQHYTGSKDKAKSRKESAAAGMHFDLKVRSGPPSYEAVK